MSNPMSGEKMVLAHSKTAVELPTMGVKEFEPNHSWLEQKQIQSALDQRKMLLEAERVEKESNLMMAEWNADRRKAVVSRTGKHWETFGHHADNADWLFPEEALFLMEMGYLECLYGEVPLSIQKAYSVFLNPENGCSLDEYQVFAHLCRAGYRVLRHLPDLTVTAYERTIRLDQHLERKTYGDAVTEEGVPQESVSDRTPVTVEGGSVSVATDKCVEAAEKTVVCSEFKEIVVDKTSDSEKVENTETQPTRKSDSVQTAETQGSKEAEEMVADQTLISEKGKDFETHAKGNLDGLVSAQTQGSNEPEEMVIGGTVSEEVKDSETQSRQKSDVVTVESQKLSEPMETDSSAEQTKRTDRSVTSQIGGLTKRQLRKIQRRKAGSWKSQRVKGVQSIRRKRQKNWILDIKRKYKYLLTSYGSSRHRHKSRRDEQIGHKISKNISAHSGREDEASETPPERWQPPVVISDLPENIEMTIGSSAAAKVGDNEKDQETIEVIDIADTSSEEDESDTDEVVSDDSDIEIIQEIPRPRSQAEEEEESEEDDDDLEIIEVPVPKKEVIVETLSSDSEKEDEDESGSESERSYDGNWKRNRPKKKKFVRPPTMSHFTFSAVDEFCAEKKPTRDNANGEGSNDFIGLESSTPSSVKRPQFRLEKTRNEILDMMPTMAGQTKKLMTLDTPDLRLVPEGVSPRQQSYTFSTNVLRARVFRQGFRGRRNFHGPRFTSFNPYYNNVNGNFYPNQQLSVAGPQALFQAPQLAQLLGGGDVNSMARGVIQIASALLMNLPQNNMNNGILPYNPRPNFPMMNPNFSQSPLNVSTPRFPPVNQNFSGNEPSNAHHRGFNLPQRNSCNLQNLFDMPQQRSFGTPNHIRFSENSNSPTNEDHSENRVDLSRSSESDFDSSDHNFTPPIRDSYGAGRNFRDNRAANFRSRRGRFVKREHQSQRGGFSQRNSIGGSSQHSQLIDPAYIKQDVPLPDEGKVPPRNSSDFIPIGSSTNQKQVEVISIDDNDDGLVPRGGISNRFTKKKGWKRKLKRQKEAAKKMRLGTNSDGSTNPEIIFLDSPSVSVSSVENPASSFVKQETESGVQVKTENRIKEESPLVSNVKSESGEESRVKVENEAATRVKTEEPCGESSGVRVKVEHATGNNISVEIKIESHSDTSSVVSLPIANLVKEEPQRIKQETVSVEVKSEAAEVVESIKAERLEGEESKEDIVRTSDSNEKSLVEADTTERTLETVVTGASECERTTQNGESVASVRTDSFEMEIEKENKGVKSNSEVTDRSASDAPSKKVSSWAEIKKNNLPLSTFQDSEIQEESESENDDEDEIRPILRPRHCKTIGTVLSALQIFAPFTGTPPEDIQRLKISFDLYLPAEFRKAHRGLPQYRIVVFSGSDPLPSPAQLREVIARFEDRVPVLAAVVSPGSVVFYTFTDIDLPTDSTSYAK